jgi:hypothetical protein
VATLTHHHSQHMTLSHLDQNLIITNDKNIFLENFPLAEKFFGFAEKTKKFFYKLCLFHEKNFW